MMKNLFEQSRSHWVRYDHYELKTAEDGKRYITPGKSAKPDVYNPLKEVPNIVLDALNVGMLMLSLIHISPGLPLCVGSLTATSASCGKPSTRNCSARCMTICAANRSMAAA